MHSSSDAYFGKARNLTPFDFEEYINIPININIPTNINIPINMSSQLEDYQHLKDLEAQPTAAQFSQEISDSLIVQYNWGDLLSAAPLALSFVGTCQLVASAPAASGIKLKRPSRDFIHLR